MEGYTVDNTAQIFMVSNLVMLIFASLIIAFVMIYQKRLLQQHQEMQRREAAHQRELLSASIQTQENERQRIAKDLHDEVGSLLSLVKMKIVQVSKTHSKSEDPSALLNETNNLLKEGIQSVRRISHDLLPPSLEKFGLETALKSMIEKAGGDGSISFIFKSEGEYQRVASEHELNLYRIIQEIFTNAAKHAHASHIVLSMNAYPDQLSIVVEDDGRGFDIEKKKAESTGLGLKNIESRILTLGGKFDLWSEIGKGTRASISLEFSQEEPMISALEQVAISPNRPSQSSFFASQS
ncbi:MAG: sensor histidine kinase [Bacteroidia bacterium]|nr:sensor histidine kinase [Bacteroidia bacterium]